MSATCSNAANIRHREDAHKRKEAVIDLMMKGKWPSQNQFAKKNEEPFLRKCKEIGLNPSEDNAFDYIKKKVTQHLKDNPKDKAKYFTNASK